MLSIVPFPVIYPIGCNAKSVRKPEGMKGWSSIKTGAKLVSTTKGIQSYERKMTVEGGNGKKVLGLHVLRELDGQ